MAARGVNVTWLHGPVGGPDTENHLVAPTLFGGERSEQLDRGEPLRTAVKFAGRLEKAMYFPQFLIGMFATSGVVVTWVYMATGSVWKALAWTVFTSAILQLGYFVLVVRLIYKPIAKDAEKNPALESPEQP
jgi:hypothetical protein